MHTPIHSNWLTCYHPRPQATIRLFCFPHGGGGPQAFKDWAEQLPAFIEVVALNLPGRGSRRAEPAIDNMPELVATVVETLTPYLDKPYALFGHSVGALVAYEVAQSLCANRLPQPVRLIVSAHEVPQHAHTDSPLHDLSDEDLLDKILSLGLVDADELENPELSEFILPPLRADFAVSETYKWPSHAPLSLPISAVSGSDDPLLSPAQMALWQDYSDDDFSQRSYCGDHFFTVSEQTQVLADIAAELNEDIDRLPPSILLGEARDYPNKCLHTLFREQAQKTPNNIAVVDVEQSLTFAELDKKTDLLARWLQKNGVTVDTIAGIYMDSCVEFVIAYLAILKAGGAYMPLETAYPQKLLKKVIKKVKPKCIITNQANAEALPKKQRKSKKTLVLGNNWVKKLKDRKLPALDAGLAKPTLDSLAYCVMTSGTTGEPKGILCPHRGAVNSYYWRYNHTPYSSDEREAINVFFVWEVLRPLLQGIPAYIIPDKVIYDPWKLVNFLSQHQITRVLFTPSLLEQILLACGDGLSDKLDKLSIVWLNGEVVPTALCQHFFAALPNTRLLNDYSISETHDVCTKDLSLLDSKHISKYAPLGNPMDNVYIYILDEQHNPVGRGISGEVYVGGDSLACGYLKDAEKTRERFISDPIKKDGSLIFRTGDAGRILANNELEVSGRLEFMIKLRGYTVVPGAVEATLNHHPDIKASVVTTIDNPQTEQPESLIAYVVAKRHIDDDAIHHDLRPYLKTRLPHYAIPTHIMILDELPLNAATGKLDRKQLPQPQQPHPEISPLSFSQADSDQVATAVYRCWQSALGVEHLAHDDNFFDLGGHSLLAIQLCQQLSQALQTEVSVIDIFEYPTLDALSQFLAQKRQATTTAAASPDSNSTAVTGDTLDDIAIIGLAGRFPGADSVDDFWENLCGGVCSIKSLSSEDLDKQGISKSIYEDDNYRRVGAIIDNVEYFDPAFWQISQKEAELMDPQQRLFLETCWHALEHAGYAPGENGENTGVFGGCYSPLYLLHQLAGGGFMDATDPMTYHLTETGNDKDYLSTRVSYLLNLQGPSITVQSSCSTALSVVASACESLQLHHCDVALAGASSITFPQAGYQYVEGHINAKEGKIRTFDADASGTILGDGVGVVTLKRLQDAIDDNDTIYAVIKGYAVNNDGGEKTGYSAPGVAGQKNMIEKALKNADISPQTIGFVEAHGTGTLIGDPIETRALTEVYRRYSAQKNYCALGSVKPNIGHSNIAAGMASLMKATLSLHHKKIPPTIHYRTPNPVMELDASPFYINKTLIDWEASPEHPRRAGVSCLGIGGTNNHFILQEAPEKAPVVTPDRSHALLVVSGKTPQALQNNQAALARYLEKHPDSNLADIEYTLQSGRRFFDYRAALSCKAIPDTIDKLSAGAGATSATAIKSSVGDDDKTVFVFPGQGSQHLHMGKDLYAAEPVYKAYFDECCELLMPDMGIDIREYLFAEPDSRKAKMAFGFAYYTQPTIVAHQIALARTLQSWGITPDVVAGHSIGEYTAAYIAGIFSLADTLKLIVARGRAMHAAGPGAMIAAQLDEKAAMDYLNNHDGVSLAVINAPGSIVFSGPRPAIAALVEALDRDGIKQQKVNVIQAFHSTMMEASSPQLTAAVKQTARRAPTLPILSNVTGTWMTEAQVFNDNYWAEHMCQTVRFADNIDCILADQPDYIIEVGASTILSTGIRAQLAGRDDKPLVVACSRHPKDHSLSDTEVLDNVIGKLWMAGKTIDWSAYRNGYTGNRIGLPGTVFDGKKCWVDNGAISTQVTEKGGALTSGEMIADVGQRSYLSAWTKTALTAPSDTLAEKAVLVFAFAADHELHDFSERLISLLKQAGASVKTVYPTDINYVKESDFSDYFARLEKDNDLPDQILYLWHLNHRESLENSYYATLYLAKAIAALQTLKAIHLSFIVNQLFQITDEEIDEIKATIIGPAIVLPQEYSQVTCRIIDIALDDCKRPQTPARLVAELSTTERNPFVVYRNGQRWLKTYTPSALPAAPKTSPFKPGNTYLLTGGFGRIGQALGKHLAKHQANLVLTTTTSLPDREDWPTVRHQSSGQPKKVVDALAHIDALEQLGAQVLVVNTGLGQLSAVGDLLDQTAAAFGRLDGVFHLAGLADLRYLPELSDAVSKSEFEPKIDALINLDHALHLAMGRHNFKPDFVMLFSSLAAILGGYSMTAYTAANRFMDHYVKSDPWKYGIRWFCVNWDDWDFDYNKEQTGAYEASVSQFALPVDQGLETIERILKLPEPQQILISTRALQPRVEKWLYQQSADISIAEDESKTVAENSDAENREKGDLSAQITRIYGEVLGVSGLSANDNFFHAGGDSLLASQILLKLRTTLQKDSDKLSLAAIFDYPTPQQLADWLAS